MNRTHIATLAALLLSGSLVATPLVSAQDPAAPPAPAAQPATPDAAPPAPPATQSPAPVERQAPAAPLPPRAPRPAMVRGRGIAGMHDRGPEQGFARPVGPGMRIVPPGMWWRDPNVVQRLSLTADQTRKMDALFQASRLQLIDLKANIERQDALLEPMLSANPVDQSRTLAQIDKVVQARAELEKADAKMLLGLRAVLTPDQWTKLQTRDGWRDSGPAGPGAAGGPGGPDGGRDGRGRGPGGPGGPADFLVAPEAAL